MININIGKVFNDSYETKGLKIPILTLDIRTVSFKRKFTISVNRYKWQSGAIGQGIPFSGEENSPDYHIWYNIANRSEAMPSEIVGSIDRKDSKNCVILDPFSANGCIKFKLIPTTKENRLNKEHIYNAVLIIDENDKIC